MVEHLPWGAGAELMDEAPETAAESVEAARELLGRVTFKGDAAFDLAAFAAAHDMSDHDFGHYLGMQALGTGVGLFDHIDKDALAPLHIPHICHDVCIPELEQAYEAAGFYDEPTQPHPVVS